MIDAHESGYKGFDEIVDYVVGLHPSVTQNDVYEAVMTTVTERRQKAIDEIQRRKQVTARHVRAINSLQKILEDQAHLLVE